MHAHRAKSNRIRVRVCISPQHARVSTQKHTITSTALIYTPAACTHQHQNNETPEPAQKIRSSAPHSPPRTNPPKKKNVHTNISKMHTPGGLRTIHIHMHMLSTIRIHIHVHIDMLSTIHRAKRNHA